MTHSDFDKMREKELGILKEFISVCEKLNLKYYVVCGTLLGAVRHKGFIPWDDDIDVGMLRADYDIFVREAQKHLSDQYFLQTRATDPEYIAGYAKLRDSSTTFIETIVKDMNMNHGMFIDIFPLDYYDEKQKKQLRYKKLAQERIVMEMIPTRNRPLRYKLMRPFAKWKYPSAEQARVAREELLRCAEKKEFIAVNDDFIDERTIVPAEWYGEGTYLSFEDVRVLAPKEYDKWLRHAFGDYMKLPPVEARKTFHETEVIDAENAYLKYMRK